MRHKIEKITFSQPLLLDGQAVRYIVKYKRHWWSGWRYILDPRTKAPELFESKGEAIFNVRYLEAST